MLAATLKRRLRLVLLVGGACALLVAVLAERRGEAPPIWEGGRAEGTPKVWDFSADFVRDSTFAQNPSADRYGNPEVWSYMEADSARSQKPSSFWLLTEYGRSLQGARGFDAWFGSDDYTASTFFPIVGVRGGGTAAQQGFAHPSTAGQAIVAWTSPISGRIRLTGAVSDQDDGGGDGVAWALNKGARALARGTLRNGGLTQTFNEAGVAVKAGDTFYLTVGPRRGYAYDSTAISLTIRQERPDRRPSAEPAGGGHATSAVRRAALARAGR